MNKKLDFIMSIWLGGIIFKAIFPTIKELAGFSDVVLVDESIWLLEVLLVPSPITYLLWALSFGFYIYKRFIKSL